MWVGDFRELVAALQVLQGAEYRLDSFPSSPSTLSSSSSSERAKQNVYVFIDAFCIDQHSSSVSPSHLASLRSIIHAIGRVVGILWPWDRPRIFTRAWCVFEMFLALEQQQQQQRTDAESSSSSSCTASSSSKATPLRFVMSPTEDSAFVDALQTNASGVSDLHATIASSFELDALQSFFATDRDMILAHLTTDFARVVEAVLSANRQWLVDCAMRALYRQPPLGRAIKPLQSSLGLLCIEVDRMDEARFLLEQAHRELRSEFGVHHEASIAGQRRLGRLQRALASFERAEELLSEAYNLSQDHLGPSHAETLACARELGVIYIKLERHAEAQLLLRQEPERNKYLLGLCYLGLDRLEEAETTLRESLAELKERRGEYHRSTLNNLDALVDVLVRRSCGDHHHHHHLASEAVGLLEEVVLKKAQRLGRRHRSTTRSQQKLGLLLLRIRGELPRSEELLCEALKTWWEEVGPESSELEACAVAVNDLVTAYKRRGLNAEAESLLNRVRDFVGRDVLASGALLKARFTLEEKIGCGGSSEVWRAVDRVTNSLVAVKVLHEDVRWGRLDAEARAVARVRKHQNLIQLLDKGRMRAGRPYLVMELAQGFSLRAILVERGRLTPIETLHVAVGMLDGLAAAHADGVSHRDIKPSNIVINVPSADSPIEGAHCIKLIDFGLARVMMPEASSSFSSSAAASSSSASSSSSSSSSAKSRSFGGAVVTTTVVQGSCPYMSPEQLQHCGGRQASTSSSDQDGIREDLWAAAVVLYEALAGVRPFDGATDFATMHNIVHEEPRDLREAVVGSCPAGICDVIAHVGLQKQPSERHSSASAFLDELEAAAVQARLVSFHAFISYRRGGEDEELASRLFDKLSARRTCTGERLRVFWDRARDGSGIETGEDFQARFFAALCHSRVFVPCVSAATLANLGGAAADVDNVLLEWQAALILHSRHHHHSHEGGGEAGGGDAAVAEQQQQQQQQLRRISSLPTVGAAPGPDDAIQAIFPVVPGGFETLPDERRSLPAEVHAPTAAALSRLLRAHAPPPRRENEIGEGADEDDELEADGQRPRTTQAVVEQLMVQVGAPVASPVATTPLDDVVDAIVATVDRILMRGVDHRAPPQGNV